MLATLVQTVQWMRGKARAKVEFGSKIGAAVVDGFTFIDHFSWDAVTGAY